MTNRTRGDYFERRTQDTLEAEGWVVLRSAGSFGPADLWAARADMPLWLVSCKTNGRLPRAEAQTLRNTALKAGAWPVLAYRPKPGWVGLSVVERDGREPLMPLHMPPVRKAPPKRTRLTVEDHEQLTIFDALAAIGEPPPAGWTP